MFRNDSLIKRFALQKLAQAGYIAGRAAAISQRASHVALQMAVQQSRRKGQEKLKMNRSGRTIQPKKASAGNAGAIPARSCWMDATHSRHRRTVRVPLRVPNVGQRIAHL